MATSNRRLFLAQMTGVAGAAAAAGVLPKAIARALAIPANRRTGTLRDVEHIVILTQENRSFDHYFGTFPGVRGFGDRFPIPRADAPGIDHKTVWVQSNGKALPEVQVVTPFHLDTAQNFGVMRVSGTPHSWPNAQQAWADGTMSEWPKFKTDRAMGYFTEAELPFQFALANAFTLCDAYHCSFQGGTNPNRLFLWTGTNDPHQKGHGPAIDNRYDNLEHDPRGGYTWTTYTERLEQAGVRWQVYEDMADNFTDNPLAGFRTFRSAYAGEAGALARLKERGLSTRDLDKLRDDVIDDNLPQVSWIVATAEGSEHPGPSSPAQGAEYTARVLDALTANPDVWSKTVLLLNFDENDGFFDHVPPPAAPSVVRGPAGAGDELAGASTVDTRGEYHEVLEPNADAEARALQHKPYGLGPRVPMYVISPWSKGGWVNSEVFDHTSVIRFIEQRFGVHEPNITPWRRAVCGDLTSAFDFSGFSDDEFFDALPDPAALSERARALPNTTTPVTPTLPELPYQQPGVRPSRALPYELYVSSDAHASSSEIRLSFVNSGRAGAVFHVYDRLHLERAPRRYTVEAMRRLSGVWSTQGDGGAYDLWVLGPNGFHRHFTGKTGVSVRGALPEVSLSYGAFLGDVSIKLNNRGLTACTFEVTPNAYFRAGVVRVQVAARAEHTLHFSLHHSAHWYDLSVRLEADTAGFMRRLAGRVETGRSGYSDPALGGYARVERA